MAADLIEAFLEYKRENRGRAVRTVQIYGHGLRMLQVYLEGRDLLTVGEDDLAAFTGPWLAKRGIVAASRRTYVAAVRQFYLWLHATRQIERNPAAGVAYPQGAYKLPRMISLANAETLMWTPDFNTFEGLRDCAIIGLLAGCGLRVSGLTSMNCSDVITDVVDGKKRLFIRVTEKGRRERMLPVPKEADLQLRMYMSHPDLQAIDRDLPDGDKVLFVSVRNRVVAPVDYRGERRRLSRRAVRVMIGKHGRAAGIPAEQLHPHALRHLYGTEMTESDVHQLVQQQLMGHRDPKSTAIYVHLAKRKLIAEVDRANPLAKMRTPTTDILKRIKT